MEKSTITIIGAGPGGYVAAIKAAQKGFNVNIIEKESCGGTCLNRGCIPTKALLYPIQYLNRNYNRMGIIIDNIRVDLNRLNNWKKTAVLKSVKGVEYLFSKYENIKLIKGEGKLVDDQNVEVNGEIYNSDFTILAMGSLPNIPKSLNVDGIWTSDDALELKEIPEKLIIIGAGVIGIEIGSIYKALGSEVVLIDVLEHIGGIYIDEEVSSEIERILRRKGLKFKLGVGVKSIVNNSVILENNERIEGDKILIATGRKSNIPQWVSENNIMVKNNKIIVDEYCRTNMENVFAIGDLIEGPMLAHKASHDGIKVIKYLTNEKVKKYPIPSVIYIEPEVAWVGMNEKESYNQFGNGVKISKFPFAANSRSNCTKELDGFVKLITYKNEILGAHIVGPNASELIWGLSLIIGNKIATLDMDDLIFPHPTYSESIHETILGAIGKFIHL